VVFFFFLIAGGDLALEEIEEELCKERERRAMERERLNFFGCRNKYGIYVLNRDNK